MKKISSTAEFAVMTLFVFGLATSVLAGPDTLEVLPTDHDFGDVEVGTTVTTIISMTNINGSDVEVYGLGFQAGGSADFSISDAPPVPFIVVPGETVEVEVAFSPSAAGYVTAVLKIESTDSLTPVHEVFLGGVGVAIQPPPITIQAILEFFDASVAAGTLDGTGRFPATRQIKVNIFRNMLVGASNMIDGGRIRAACWLINRVYLLSDGLARPRDFVDGEARAEMNGMIGQLMADMGCQ